MTSSRGSGERLLILVLLLFFWWGLPLSIMLSGGIPERIQVYDYTQRFRGGPFFGINFPNMLLVVWLLNTVIPMFPGAGLLSAIVGAATRDRPVSFLLGYTPYALTALLFGLGSVGEEVLPVNRIGTLLAAAVGFGLIGLSGTTYGDWKSSPEVQGAIKARLAVLAFLAGLALWFIPFWVWPRWQ